MSFDPNDEALWAMPVPPGEVRTALNPPSSVESLMAAGISTTVIASFAVATRVFTRFHVVKGLGIDDCKLTSVDCALGNTNTTDLVMISMILALVYSVLTLYSIELGAGNHTWDIPGPKFMDFMFYQMLITIFYSTAVSFSKLSILTFYLRLSPERGFRLLVYILIGIVISYTLVYEFLSIFQCTPVSKFWNLVLEGTCLGRMVPMMTLSVANAVIDVVILLIPIRVVLPLKIPRRQKVSLTLLFATGGFVCAATIQRTVILPGLLKATDYTWEVPPQMIWGFVEINAGLVCASVPALRPFFMRYLPFIIASHLSSARELPSDETGSGGFDSSSNAIKKDRRRNKKIATQSHELSSQDFLPGRRDVGDEAKLWERHTAEHHADGVTSGNDDTSLGSVNSRLDSIK